MTYGPSVAQNLWTVTQQSARKKQQQQKLKSKLVQINFHELKILNIKLGLN